MVRTFKELGWRIALRVAWEATGRLLNPTVRYRPIAVIRAMAGGWRLACGCLRSLKLGANELGHRWPDLCAILRAAEAAWRKHANSRRFLCSDVVGYSRLAGADEDRILARLRALRSDLIDPTIAVHHGRVVKRTGDGALVEFRSVVDAVLCAIEVQNVMVERNAGVPEDRRIVFRIGIHLGDVVEESDGDLMGDGVNIAARLEGAARHDLSVGAGLLASQGAARSRCHRSGPDPAQEYRRARAGLLTSSRTPRPSETVDAQCADFSGKTRDATCTAR